MELHRHKLDLLVVTESWLSKDDHVTSNVPPDGFDIVSNPKKQWLKGVVGYVFFTKPLVLRC